MTLRSVGLSFEGGILQAEMASMTCTLSDSAWIHFIRRYLHEEVILDSQYMDLDNWRHVPLL